MADIDRRPGGFRGHQNNRKRRYRGTLLGHPSLRSSIPRSLPLFPLDDSRQADTGLLCTPDDDDFDQRAQRRRYEEPVSARLRRQLLGITESVRAGSVGSWSTITKKERLSR